MSMKRCPGWLALVGLIALSALSGCCNWCEKHCPACHQPTVAACQPAPTCCVPCCAAQPGAPVATNYQAPPAPAPAQAQGWSRPTMTCTCTPN